MTEKSPNVSTPAVSTAVTAPAAPLMHFDGVVSVTDSGRRAIDWLAEATPLSRQQIKKAMACGAVWLLQGKQQKRLRRVTADVVKGTQLRVCFDAGILATQPPLPQMLANEGQYSVWYKPPGVLAQGSLYGDHCALLRMVEQMLNRPAFLIHRLDREASGLMLVAHTEKAAAALSQLFQGREVQKHYRVRVQGKLQPQALPLSMAQPLDGKPAQSWIEGASYDAETNTTLIDVSIDTGRKHQIRRHLASLGHPVVGDIRYGARAAEDGFLRLQACRLQFICPISRRQRDYRVPT